MRLFCALVLALVVAPACAVRPSKLPPKAPHLFVVKTVKLAPNTPTVTHFAEHTFFDLAQTSETGRTTWRRLEVNGGPPRFFSISEREALADKRWTRHVAILGVLDGCDARNAQRDAIEAAREYASWDSGYTAWPGPNSNTFGAWIIRETGMWVELDHNAVGANHAGFSVNRTTAGPGVQLDTPVLGLQIGLVEGIEVHLLQLEFGVGLFHPAIKLPVLPRLGVQSWSVGSMDGGERCSAKPAFDLASAERL